MKMKFELNGTRIFLIGQGIFVLGIFAYFFFSNIPNAISPIAGKVVSDPDFIFEIENGNEVIVSRDEDFTNPFILKEGSDFVLPPGVYYWKVKGFLRESEVHTFTIEGRVGLNLREGEDKNLLENSGNVDLNINEKKGGITSSSTLDADKSIEADKKSSFEGEEK